MNPLHLHETARPLALAALALLALGGPALGAVRGGTNGNDTLIGTNGADQLTGKGGNDALKGLAGADTYHFADDWGGDTLEEKRSYRVNGKRIPGGTDTLSFAGVRSDGVSVQLVPQWRGMDPGYNRAYLLPGTGDNVELGNARVENVVGAPQGYDFLRGGAGANRIDTGGGAGDSLYDMGGWDDGAGGKPELPPSDDTYAGAAANTNNVFVVDWGGDDVLDLLPLRSDDVVLNRVDCEDGDAERECLQIVTGTGGTSQVIVVGHFGEHALLADSGQRGRVEELRFADRTVTFGGKKAAATEGEALLGVAETERQRHLAERAPELAEAAREQMRELSHPDALPTDRGR